MRRLQGKAGASRGKRPSVSPACLQRLKPLPSTPQTSRPPQTHTTPVLMNAGERAELATEEYVPLTPLLEGVVVLRKNPDFMDVAE